MDHVCKLHCHWQPEKPVSVHGVMKVVPVVLLVVVNDSIEFKREKSCEIESTWNTAGLKDSTFYWPGKTKVDWDK